jgi:predicted nicotinamide N-methyase
LAQLKLKKKPDLILASDVVYGNDPEKWGLLIKSIRDLSGPDTLLIVGNVQRYPINHPMAESKFFQESTAEDFCRKEVPVRNLHSDFQKTGGGACVVHVFRRKTDTSNEGRGKKKRDSDQGDIKKGEKKRKKEKRQ